MRVGGSRSIAREEMREISAIREFFKRITVRKRMNPNESTWEETCEHYGYKLDEDKKVITGHWRKEIARQHFKNIEEVLDWDKRIQVIFEYDPDYPRAYVKIKGSKLER